ncbi:MAG: PepSY domain-containing protein [Bacteriovoracaceae bacterium]
MKYLMFTLMTVFLVPHAFAETECTKEPVSKWKNQESFKKELEATYKIKVFKVTKGNCFEIYGWNKANKKVEIYFNPVDGKIVKERIE